MKSYWIDALKTIGIILVVVGHSGCPAFLEKFIYGFHMPLFFLISGYLFNEDKWLGKGYRCFIKNRYSYIRLYFIWALINLVLNFPIELLDDGFMIKQTIDSTLRHILWILVSYGGSKEYPNSTPLWFLPCLFVASLYLYGIVWIENRKGLYQAMFILLFMFLANYAIGLNKSFIIPWHLDVALSSSIIMFVGYQIKRFSILSKPIPKIILFSLFIFGTVVIMANEKIDMNMNKLGIHPLFYLGSLSMSFVLMYLFSNAREDVWNHSKVVINRIGGGQKYNHYISS